MRFWEFTALTAIIVNTALAAFVARGNSRSPVKLVYLGWASTLILWNLGALFMYGDIGHNEALLWARVLLLGVIFMPITLFHLCLIVAEAKIPRFLLGFIYILHIGFALTLPTHLFIADVRLLDVGWWTVPGPLFYCFIISYTISTTGLLATLYRKQRTDRFLQKMRLRVLLVAVFTLWILGTNDLMPILGRETYPFTNTNFIPLGNIAAVFYGLTVAYCVLHFELLDVHVVFGKVAAHIVRLLFVLLVGAFLLLILYTVAPHEFTTFAFFSSLGVLMISAVIASIFFPRLFGSGGDSLERRILGDRFEYHDKIRSFISSMQWYGNSDQLLDDLETILTKVLRVRSYHIILREESRQGFSVFRTFQTTHGSNDPTHTDYNAIFHYFHHSGKDYFTLNTPDSPRRGHSPAAAAQKELEGFDAALCFPFYFQETPFGLLLIGNKGSGEPFTGTDIDLLLSLVKNLALITNQLRLQAQVLQQQELELLGRMSGGMAHDLNNLLTPISTFFQLSGEGVCCEELQEELLPVASRNVATIRSYIREALFFSENLRPDFQLGRVDILIAHALDLARASRPNRDVKLVQNLDGEVLIEMDEVLVQRMVSNVIVNSIDASPAGSTVQVQIRSTTLGAENRQWLQIRVIDSGMGIKKEHLERIFTPYFTTKNRGDESRGFGLGLAICRKIAILHGGTLDISSKLGEGTIVQIDLPTQQAFRTAPAVSRV